jgi:hypothetical protein
MPNSTVWSTLTSRAKVVSYSNSKSESLCRLCQNALKKFLSHGDYLENKHHQSLASLRKSVAQGCKICFELHEIVSKSTPPSEKIVAVAFHWGGKKNLKFSVRGENGVDLLSYRICDLDRKYRNYHVSMQIANLLAELDTLELDYQLTDSTGSQETLDLVYHWLSSCQQHHPECSPAKESGWAPTRLLDLGSTNIDNPLPLRLVSTQSSGITPEYASLSHCWGHPDSMKLRLLESNIGVMMSSIEFSTLPKTFQDAVTLSRRCGFRYLWIDALCIIQDSTGKVDWNREALLMDKVYQQSSLNICASDAADSQRGFFRSREKRLIQAPLYTYRKRGTVSQFVIKKAVDAPQLLSDLEQSPLYTRGWVSQERLLSSRLIHCKNQAMVWECRRNAASELDPTGFDYDPLLSDLYVRRDLFSKSSLSPSTALDNKLSISRDLFRAWTSLIERYSTCNFTKVEDKLIAIAGMAKALQPKYGRYSAGMWHMNFLWELCWVTVEQRNGTKPSVYLAPSWSWAAGERSIRYVAKSCLRTTKFTEVADVVSIDITGDIGHIESGHLRITGKVIPAVLRHSPSEPGAVELDITRNNISFTLLDDVNKDVLTLDDPRELRTSDPLDVFLLPIMKFFWAGTDYDSMVLRKVGNDEYRRVGFSCVRSWTKYVDVFESIFESTQTTEIRIS